MRRCKSLILGLALAFAPMFPAFAAPAVEAILHPPVEQAAPAFVQAHPALWRVERADTTIYLFGTIHLLRQEILWFDGPVRRAFDAAQDVVLEVVDEGGAQMQNFLMARDVAPNSTPLSSQLPKEQGEKLLAAMADNGAPAILFDHVKPWVAAMTLPVLVVEKLGYSAASGVDRAIKAEAIAAGKTLIGLETMAEQLGFFDSLPHDLQLALLGQTVEELPALPQTIARMIAAWGSGEPDHLAMLMNESVDSNSDLRKLLLTDRNARWADWIATRLEQPGTVFIAVGAGHLAGDDSVQHMLRQRGIETSRVPQD